jgi:hypothetical protein
MGIGNSSKKILSFHRSEISELPNYEPRRLANITDIPESISFTSMMIGTD